MRNPKQTPEEVAMEEIERLREIAQEQKMARTKGHARLALAAKGPYLEVALENYITLPRITEALAEQGIAVSVASLRKWLMEFRPDHYADYLQATGRGQRKNRAGAAGATEEMGGANKEPGSGKQKEEAAPATTDQVGRGKQSEETQASRTRIDSTAIGKSFDQMKADAEEAARLLGERYKD